MDVSQSPRSLELLKGIVSLSRPLGLTVTIEGVETFEQLKILALEVKPDLVQGFLFGAALTASGIETMSSTVWPFAKDIHGASRAAAKGGRHLIHLSPQKHTLATWLTAVGAYLNQFTIY